MAYATEHLGDNEGLGWAGMDTCHEISARDDTGVDEVFQVIARKLVERRQEIERERLHGPSRGNHSDPRAADRDVDASHDGQKKGKCC